MEGKLVYLRRHDILRLYQVYRAWALNNSSAIFDWLMFASLLLGNSLYGFFIDIGTLNHKASFPLIAKANSQAGRERFQIL